jgi:hypothetical protein
LKEKNLLHNQEIIIITITNTRVCILKASEKEKCLGFFLNRNSRNSPFNNEFQNKERMDGRKEGYRNPNTNKDK